MLPQVSGGVGHEPGFGHSLRPVTTSRSGSIAFVPRHAAPCPPARLLSTQPAPVGAGTVVVVVVVVVVDVVVQRTSTFMPTPAVNNAAHNRNINFEKSPFFLGFTIQEASHVSVVGATTRSSSWSASRSTTAAFTASRAAAHPAFHPAT